MGKTKAILYDLDGVLVDACEWHYDALNMALEAVEGITISREDHLSIFNGLPSNTKLELLKKQGLIKEKNMPEIWQLKQDYTVDAIKNKAFEDHYKIKLHRWAWDHGIRCVCVTNSIKMTARMMLECTGQFDWMEFIISNEDTKKPKPAPDPYLFAMSKLGYQPENVLIVEDSDKGYQSAIASNARVLRVKDCYDVTQELIEGNV